MSQTDNQPTFSPADCLEPSNPISSKARMQNDEVLPYMKEVYDWAYVKPSNVKWLDRNFVVQVLLFFNDQRMMRAYLSMVKPGQKVWQVAHVYGDLVKKVATKIGPKGVFWLNDATPIQVTHARHKLSNLPQSQVWHADAARFSPPDTPDLICSFFLLHEVPDDKKRAIVANMLNHLTDDGEVLFIDYHRPAMWQPIRWILLFVNRWLEPFAESMWKHEISDYAEQPERYHWEKQTIFGGVYQIVKVTRKQ